MKQGSAAERLKNGILTENPTFVLTLGMCPTLAVTTSAVNGLGMGLTTMAVLALSNMFISMLRKVIPDKVRIPAFIVVIASFVTVVELLLKAYIPFLYDAVRPSRDSQPRNLCGGIGPKRGHEPFHRLHAVLPFKGDTDQAVSVETEFFIQRIHGVQ